MATTVFRLGHVVIVLSILPSGPPNAAPEWQAGSFGWRCKVLVMACPLEGPDRRSDYLQYWLPLKNAKIVSSISEILFQLAISKDLKTAINRGALSHDNQHPCILRHSLNYCQRGVSYNWIRVQILAIKSHLTITAKAFSDTYCNMWRSADICFVLF